MLETQHLKLKKIELTDSPPDITVINPNWDEIDKQIEVLTNERGYLNPKGVNSTLGLPTGFYSKWVGSNDIPLCDQFNFIRLKGQDPDFISTIGIHPVSNVMFHRGSDKQGWKQITTTEKVDFVQDNFLNGFVIDSSQQNSVAKSGKTCVLKLYINSPVDIINWTTLLIIPEEYRPRKNVGMRAVCENGYSSILNIQPDGAVRIMYLSPQTWVGISIPYCLD